MDFSSVRWTREPEKIQALDYNMPLMGALELSSHKKIRFQALNSWKHFPALDQMEMLMGVSERLSFRLSDPRTEINDFPNLMGALQ
jgi:hypothetical protein